MRTLLLLLCLMGAEPASAQYVPRFSMESSQLALTGTVRSWARFADPANQAAVYGSENGRADVWTGAWRLVRDLRLSFQLEDGSWASGESLARQITTRAEGITIVYAHPTFSVRQHIFTPRDEPGAIILLESRATRAFNVRVEAAADLNVVWPGLAGGGHVRWNSGSSAFEISAGGLARFSALLGSPLATEPSTVTLHEPPLQQLRFTVPVPAQPTGFIPIIVAGGSHADSAQRTFARLLGNAPALWRQKSAHVRRALQGLTIESPDARLNQTFGWAKLLTEPGDTVLRDTGEARISAAALGLLDEAEADSLLHELSSSAFTTDWGVRAGDRVSVPGTLTAALAHLRYHRAWSGHDLLRDAVRGAFDFSRGQIPPMLAAAFYGAPEPGHARPRPANGLLMSTLVRGLLGVEADPPNRALALEPHLPADWSTLSVNNIAVGRERVHMTVRRSVGKYQIALRREGSGGPLFVRLAPALPLGSDIERVRVDDHDAPVQSDATAHDVHAVVELQLAGSSEIEIDYSGGIEVLAPPEQVDMGDASSELRVLDFRRSQREYLITTEGPAGSSATLVLRAESRVRSLVGAEIVEQNAERLVVRIRLPVGAAAITRREVRLRT